MFLINGPIEKSGGGGYKKNWMQKKSKWLVCNFSPPNPAPRVHKKHIKKPWKGFWFKKWYISPFRKGVFYIIIKYFPLGEKFKNVPAVCLQKKTFFKTRRCLGYKQNACRLYPFFGAMLWSNHCLILNGSSKYDAHVWSKQKIWSG